MEIKVLGELEADERRRNSVKSQQTQHMSLPFLEWLFCQNCRGQELEDVLPDLSANGNIESFDISLTSSEFILLLLDITRCTDILQIEYGVACIQG